MQKHLVAHSCVRVDMKFSVNLILTFLGNDEQLVNRGTLPKFSKVFLSKITGKVFSLTCMLVVILKGRLHMLSEEQSFSSKRYSIAKVIIVIFRRRIGTAANCSQNSGFVRADDGWNLYVCCVFWK